MSCDFRLIFILEPEGIVFTFIEYKPKKPLGQGNIRAKTAVNLRIKSQPQQQF
jgi:hypothetical protein